MLWKEFQYLWTKISKLKTKLFIPNLAWINVSFKVVNYFHKKLYHKYLARSRISKLRLESFRILKIIKHTFYANISGFGLTIQKGFVIFPNENNCKNDLKCRPRKIFFATKKMFQSRSPKIALNGVSFTFLSYWIKLDLHLTLEDFHNKELH